MWADFSIASSLRLSARWPLSAALWMPHTRTAYQHLLTRHTTCTNVVADYILWCSYFKMYATPLWECHIYSKSEEKNNFFVTVSVTTFRKDVLSCSECEYHWRMIEYKCKKTPGRQEGGWVTDTTFEFETDIVWMQFLSKIWFLGSRCLLPVNNSTTHLQPFSLIHTYTDTHPCAHILLDTIKGFLHWQY